MCLSCVTFRLHLIRLDLPEKLLLKRENRKFSLTFGESEQFFKEFSFPSVQAQTARTFRQTPDQVGGPNPG